jgi:hypothetical protein
MKYVVIVLSMFVSLNVSAESFSDANTGIVAGDATNIGRSILYTDIAIGIDGNTVGYIPVSDAQIVCNLLGMSRSIVVSFGESDSHFTTIVSFAANGTVAGITSAQKYADFNSVEKVYYIKNLSCDKI